MCFNNWRVYIPDTQPANRANLYLCHFLFWSLCSSFCNVSGNTIKKKCRQAVRKKYLLGQVKSIQSCQSFSKVLLITEITTSQAWKVNGDGEMGVTRCLRIPTKYNKTNKSPFLETSRPQYNSTHICMWKWEWMEVALLLATYLKVHHFLQGFFKTTMLYWVKPLGRQSKGHQPQKLKFWSLIRYLLSLAFPSHLIYTTLCKTKQEFDCFQEAGWAYNLDDLRWRWFWRWNEGNVEGKQMKTVVT